MRMDENNTSPEWQRQDTDVIVLPVGALEQHAAHLPLATDTIVAEHVARKVADHFNACLLPTIKIATSFEHSAMRGSFSLKPETCMQVVRDLAEESQRQDFRIMILINGHGGNFSLGPVVRDINRRDGGLKIIMIGALDFVPPDITTACLERKFDLHCGENETSIMLYVAPDKVKEFGAAPPPEKWNVPFTRPDLNTFGINQFCPNGSLGDFSLATREKGEQMMQRAFKPMCEFLEDRIARLRENWNYGK